MNRILSLLVAFVFIQTQAFALSGGPNYGGTTAVYTGTYAGVLLPDAGAVGGLVALDANSLGLFVLGVPQTGVATGGVGFFNKGEVFVGKIVALIDPDNGELTGLMEASAIRIITVEATAGSAVGSFGSDVRTVGTLKATIELPDEVGTSQRVEGVAVLNSFSDANRNADGTPIISGFVNFIVDGFKQSNDTTGTTTFDFDINSSSASAN